MRLSKSLRMEVHLIKEYLYHVHNEIYSYQDSAAHSAEAYQFILSVYSNNIHEQKARLEQIMDLTDKKDGILMEYFSKYNLVKLGNVYKKKFLFVIFVEFTIQGRKTALPHTYNRIRKIAL